MAGGADQHPINLQDSVIVTTDAAHHGAQSLAMTFDGMYTPLMSGEAEFIGVVTQSPPPAAAMVTMWMATTAAGSVGVGADLYADSPNYSWYALTDVVLPAGSTPVTWKQIVVSMPIGVTPSNFGVKVSVDQSFKGTIYLDEVSW